MKNDEPIHIHVEKGNVVGKLWLEPTITIAYMHNFTGQEEQLIMEIIHEKIEMFKEKWNEHFL